MAAIKDVVTHLDTAIITRACSWFRARIEAVVAVEGVFIEYIFRIPMYLVVGQISIKYLKNYALGVYFLFLFIYARIEVAHPVY